MFLLIFMHSGQAVADSPVADHSGAVAAVAVRYDGWIPQHGGFNPSRCSVELRYGVASSGVKANGIFFYYPVHAQPYERRSSKRLGGESLALDVYPSHVAFSLTNGKTKETFEFMAGTNPSDTSFWSMVNHIQFTATKELEGTSGPQVVQTVIFDCQVSQVTLL